MRNEIKNRKLAKWNCGSEIKMDGRKNLEIITLCTIHKRRESKND